MTAAAWFLSERNDRLRRGRRPVALPGSSFGSAAPTNIRQAAEVAQIEPVSVGTVSIVFNRPGVTGHTAGRVDDAMNEQRFVQDEVERQLNNGRSRCIGIVVLDVGDPFFADVARGAEMSAKDCGFALLIGCSDDDRDRESDYLDLFEEQRVHGVLIAPTGNAIVGLERLRSRGIPAVLLGRVAGEGEFSSVSVDDVAGGRLAVEHLAETGRRRIAFVGDGSKFGQVHDRHVGARQAAADHPYIAFESIETVASTMTQGVLVAEEIVRRPPADRPDAFFAANDLVAVGLLQGLLNNQVRVPEEIALIGYDDISFAESAIIPLSSITQPSELIGSAAVELLLRQGDGHSSTHEQVVFRPTLVARQSTAVPSAEQ